jgi:tetratricopeptide (TPR) repeat protein/mono/diheme cytochrome c family protein
MLSATALASHRRGSTARGGVSGSGRVAIGARVLARVAVGVLAGTAAIAQDAAAQAAVTFSRDVAPIIFGRCSSCHRPGEIGPFSLLTYQDVRPRASAIARVTRSHAMPPWKPEPGYGDFLGARQLTEAQIDTIQRWINDGAVEGDPSDLPPLPKFPEGWGLGQPDLVITMAEPYTLPAGGPDVLRNFVIPIPLKQMRYVKGVEFRPGNAGVVHHANMRIDRTATSRLLDQADPAPGFDGLITSGHFPDGHFLGWTPGQLPPLADAMAWRLEPDSDLVVQLHMHPGGRPEIVQPSIGFFFTDRPPERTPLMLRLGRQNVDISPGVTNYLVEDSYVLPVDVDVYTVQPHAHFRAREVKGYATLPNGTKKWLIYIKDWDFNWQDVYRYAEPFALPKGTTLAMQYVYDNSADNRRNPDRPPKRVRWGQNSTDEMGDLWIQVLPRTTEDRKRLVAGFGPKVMAEDAAGYEKLLEVDPRNVRLHDAVAVIYLALDRTEEAVAHLTEALRVDPEFELAHYNLATALVGLNRLSDAVDHFRRAVQIKPAFVAARVNLGAVLRLQHRFDEATTELGEALRLEPGNAVAHTNLGGILVAQHKPREAIAEYRLALRANPDLLESLTSLGWTLATSPDAAIRQPAEAGRLAARADDLTNHQDARVLDTLAAAYAAEGRFAQAVATEQRALELAETAGNRDAADQLRSRLELYRRNRPFRDGTRAEAESRP